MSNPSPPKWTKERTAKFKATMAAKRAAGWNPMPKGSKKAKALGKKSAASRRAALINGTVEEFPLDAIPDRPARGPYRKKGKVVKVPTVLFNGLHNGGGKLADKVFAEYDLTLDQMTLVLGRLRLPLRIKM